MRLLEPLSQLVLCDDALVDEHVDQHGDDAHVAGIEFGCAIFFHRSLRVRGGHPAPHQVPAQPAPAFWLPAIRIALTTIRAPEVCRHNFVGGDRADVACWVLNGDSEDLAENISVVQSFAR